MRPFDRAIMRALLRVPARDSAPADEIIEDGGKGSGNFGHKGRPGLRGGSGKGGSKELRVEENGSYVGIQRASAFKDIARKARESSNFETWTKSLTKDQYQQIVAQHKKCGTQQSLTAYAKRVMNLMAIEPVRGHSSTNKVVNGKNIVATFQRRPIRYEFEIDDVINAQGFDGVPKVVNRAEFDAAVKAANGGKGFIAQRVYSAPNQETLDQYRDMLYHGEWYINCGTGGAQYGQGMYCAADYEGELSSGIQSEMDHYISQYSDLSEEKVPRDEWLKSAKEFLADMAPRYAGKDDNGNRVDLGKWIQENPELADAWADAYYDSDHSKSKPLLDKIPEEYRRGLNYVLSYVPKEVPQPHYIETLTLTPDAKIISYKDIYKLREREGILRGVDEMEKTGKYSQNDIRLMREYADLDMSAPDYNQKVMDIGKRLSKEAYDDSDDYFRNGKRSLPQDNGVFAALMGYDAINAENHGASGSYTVILNRTKCIFLDPKEATA